MTNAEGLGTGTHMSAYMSWQNAEHSRHRPNYQHQAIPEVQGMLACKTCGANCQCVSVCMSPTYRHARCTPPRALGTAIEVLDWFFVRIAVR
jgi:hypothetical protein